MSEFKQRRHKLFDKMQVNSVALIFSGVSKYASEDETYPFVVNTNFYYLTGITQENSMLLLIKGIGEEKEYLFIDEYNEVKEKWTGKKLTVDEASLISEITNVYTNNTLDSILTLALAKDNNQYGAISRLYLDLSSEIKIRENTSTRELKNAIKSRFAHISVQDIYEMIVRLRMIKSQYEIDCIRKAIYETSNGINHLIVNIKQGVYEYSLADSFEFYGRSRDRLELAFPTIVASGKNATCLHYPTQTSQLGEKELILFDLGYKHQKYSADISRTYPVNGTFNELQRNIYEVVLMCNKAVIEYAKPGLTLKDLQEFASNFLREKCVERKLMSPTEDIRKYYYHGVSHHLGLNTHDPSLRELPLEPGNIITVEPGLYFAQHNIGVRIEDDVLITQQGSENLSINIPKDIYDIEKMFKSRG